MKFDIRFALSSIAVLSMASPLVGQTLIDHYEFEDNGTDSAGGDANGAVGANVTFTTGFTGQGAVFGTSATGTVNRIDVPQAAAFDPGNGDFSMAFFVQRDDVDTGSSDGVFDALNGTTTGYQTQFTDTGNLRLRIDDVSFNDLIDSTTAINDSDFHHYAFVVDRTNDQALVYIDGMLVTRSTG